MNTTTPTSSQETGLTLNSTGLGMLAAPRNIRELMGNPDSSTLISFMRFARKSLLTKQKNEISERLGGIHKAKQATLETLAKIGPSRIGEINIDTAFDAAANLTDAGFGKHEAKVVYANRDDAKKNYVFTISIIRSGTKDGAYNRDLVSTTNTIPFDAETKKLLKQVTDFDKRIEVVETELLAVKSDFANLDNWIEEKQAILAVQQIAGLEDGRAQLEKFLGKAVVAEMLGASA